jgi:Xaa-Pro aminopeptidase
MTEVRQAPSTATAARINLSGLEAMFGQRQIDCLVCRSGMNVTYLSGIATPGTLGRHLDLTETPRETFVLWPASGEPVVVLSEIASGVAEATGWATTLETYKDYLDSPELILARVLRDMNLDRGRVGFDQAWFSARRWAALTRLLPDLQPVDCTDDLDNIRAIKTPAEVALLHRSAELLDVALKDVFETVEAGLTERQVHARISARALELGIGTIHGILQADSNPVLYGGESDLRLRRGDLVRTDYVAYVDGYAANLSRPLHIGPPSPGALATYATYLDIYEEAVDLLRPGAIGGRVHEQIQAKFTSRGWEAGPPISGHGIGIWFHQQRPLLVEGSTDVLLPGMVVAIEPISGHWHLQDEYLITESNPTRISDGFVLKDLPWAE